MTTQTIEPPNRRVDPDRIRNRQRAIRLSVALLLLVVAILIVAACGSSDDEGLPSSESVQAPTSPTSDATTGSTGPTTSSSRASSSTTANQTTSSTASATTAKPAPVQYRPEGSGCSPGPGGLPDGRWFGYLSDPTADDADFDLACWFVGEAAVRAAEDDGAESPPPNDYYVRNASRQFRVVPIDPDARVVWFADFGDPTTEQTTSYAEWLARTGDRPAPAGIWLTVEGGEATELEEQWTP